MSTAELETTPEPKPAKRPSRDAPSGGGRDRADRRPSRRNRAIYERRILGGETLAALAKEYKVTHQRIAQIAGHVEGWIAAHPEDQLAERLRLRCRLRYESVYESAMRGFADSRKEEVTVKHRQTSRAAKGATAQGGSPSAQECPTAERNAAVHEGEPQNANEVVTTVEERIVRQRHGDPRLLATALKAVEKLERFASALSGKTERGSSAAERRAKRDRAQRESQDAARAARIQEANRQRAEADAWLTAYDVKTKPPLPTSLAAHDAPRTAASSVSAADSPPPTSPTTQATAPAALGPIGWNKNGPVVLIASQRHVEQMRLVAERGLPGNQVIMLRGETHARTWLQEPNAEAAVIWIEDELHLKDHRGVPQHGGAAAEHLARRGATCPVVMGKNETSSERATFQTLSDAGLRVEVLPPGEFGWLERSWLPMVRRKINGEQHSSETR